MNASYLHVNQLCLQLLLVISHELQFLFKDGIGLLQSVFVGARLRHRTVPLLEHVLQAGNLPLPVLSKLVRTELVLFKRFDASLYNAFRRLYNAQWCRTRT